MVHRCRWLSRRRSSTKPTASVPVRGSSARANDAGCGSRHRRAGGEPAVLPGRAARPARRRRPAADGRRRRPVPVPRAAGDAHPDPRAGRSRGDVRRRTSAVRGVLGLLQRLRPGRPAARGVRRRDARARNDQRRLRTRDPGRVGRRRRNAAGWSCPSAQRRRGRDGRRLRGRTAGASPIPVAPRLPRGAGDPGRARPGSRARRRRDACVLPLDPEDPVEAAGLGRAGRRGPADVPPRSRAGRHPPGRPCPSRPVRSRRPTRDIDCGSSPLRGTTAPAGSSTFRALA